MGRGKDQELLEAARSGDIKNVSKLLELTTKRHGPLSSFRRSPSINCQDTNGYTSLHHACLNGHSNIARLLLAHEAKLDVPDVRGSTSLYLAAWAGHQDIVKMLLMHSPKAANPNAQTIENETPLHSAAQHGHNAVVAILLAYGADPCIRNNSFQTALDLASQFGRLQVVQILLRAHPDLITPYRCVGNDDFLPGHSPTFAPTPTKHIFTHTCLHLASRNGHKKVVDSLLAAGVDVNILTHAGSALHEAALCGKKSVVSTLLKAGVDVQATDGNGRTALDLLKDYPPHVTYDIVTVINEFCNVAHFQPINLQNGTAVIEQTQSLPKRLYEKNVQKPKTAQIDFVPKPRKTPVYKPVYQQPYQGAFMQPRRQLSDFGATMTSRSIEYINLLNNGGSGSDEQPTTQSSDEVETPPRYRCVDEYVEMSEPTVSSQRSSAALENAGFANVPNATAAMPASALDNNNNTELLKMRATRSKTHSPTPDYPPPTVTEAEHTIFKYMQPTTLQLKRQTLTLAQDIDYDSLRTSSVTSDCVEHYVSEEPFAGLFKGSTLNLVQEDVVDGLPVTARDPLRSPSLVRSVPAALSRRSLSRQRFSTTGEDFSASRVWAEIDTIFESIGNEVLRAEQEPDTEPTDITEAFKVTKGIENESVATMQAVELPINEPLEIIEFSDNGGSVAANSAKANNSIRQSLHIRNPADLLLDVAESTAANWCHSPYTLLYGEIRYTVFYLGSTVIRQLQGTISTRKSIQKLKIGADLVTASGRTTDANLLEKCNTSTKYLKAANLRARLEVGIGISYVGVRFIDLAQKSALCTHDIENINCVCQDFEDLRYFAYITKEQELHYCHVFMVDNIELAKEVILTLGEAFEVAYQLVLNRQCTPIAEEEAALS